MVRINKNLFIWRDLQALNHRPTRGLKPMIERKYWLSRKRLQQKRKQL